VGAPHVERQQQPALVAAGHHQVVDLGVHHHRGGAGAGPQLDRRPRHRGDPGQLVGGGERARAEAPGELQRVRDGVAERLHDPVAVDEHRLAGGVDVGDVLVGDLYAEHLVAGRGGVRERLDDGVVALQLEGDGVVAAARRRQRLQQPVAAEPQVVDVHAAEARLDHPLDQVVEAVVLQVLQVAALQQRQGHDPVQQQRVG
jgi:hypothetical protein